jgi:hypothetical protein
VADDGEGAPAGNFPFDLGRHWRGGPSNTPRAGAPIRAKRRAPTARGRQRSGPRHVPAGAPERALL